MLLLVAADAAAASMPPQIIAVPRSDYRGRVALRTGSRVHLVAIAWIYVVLMMAAAEAAGSGGTLLGALFIVLFYGALPLSIVLYLMGARARRLRLALARRASAPRAVDPDGSGHPPGGGVAAEGKEAR